MSSYTTPDFLAIGVLTYDVTPERENVHGRVRPGGAAAFAAMCARSLGLKTAVVASAGPEYPLATVLPGVDVHLVESDFTTFFQNVYGPSGTRKQILGARASCIRLSDIPAAWRDASIVFLGPLVGEVPVNAKDWFPESAVGAAVQGWLRRWDQYGLITEETGPSSELAKGITPGYRLLAGSRMEFPREEQQSMVALGEYARVIGVTDGENGSHVYSGNTRTKIHAYPANEIDPTGAGDIWATACLIRLVETDDLIEAAHFANAAASISVEREGLSGAPSRLEIAERMGRRNV